MTAPEQAMCIFLVDDWCYIAAETQGAASAFYRSEGFESTEDDTPDVQPRSLNERMCLGDNPEHDESIPYSEAIRRHAAEGKAFPAIMAMVDL